VEVVRPSEHGLPFMGPEEAGDWLRDGVEHQIRRELGLPVSELPASDEPALAVVPTSRPELTDRYQPARPFSRLVVWNIPLVGPVAALWHSGFDPLTARWRDVEGREVRVVLSEGVVLGESLGGAIGRAWRSADPGSLDEEGIPANPSTVGILRPAPTIATGVRLIGKESRHLGAGRELLTGPEHLDYGGQDDWPIIREAATLLAPEPRAKVDLATGAGVSVRYLDQISKGRKPSDAVLGRLRTALAGVAKETLRRDDESRHLPATDTGVLAVYLVGGRPPRRVASNAVALLADAKSDGAASVVESEQNDAQQESNFECQMEFVPNVGTRNNQP
jgi:hypothetical protein